MTYTPSQVAAGETERIREHSFTRWMSRELLQAATDFCRNIGLVALYAECSSAEARRYLFWRPPGEALIEVRSGRTLEQFEQLDAANRAKHRTLLSLHVNESGLHSAVWISPAHWEAAKSILAVYGITPAQPHPGIESSPG